MELQVPIEKTGNDNYIARGGPLMEAAEGATPEEAMSRFRDQVLARLSSGAELKTITIPEPGNALLKYAGMFKDDADFNEVVEIMAERRRQMDAGLPVRQKRNTALDYAGMFKDDPYFDEAIEIMAERRRQMDAEPDVP